MWVAPCTVTEARTYVARWHRHLPIPPKGGRFALAAIDHGDHICGVAIIGHGARGVANRYTATVTRVATDGTPNACSMLYGAAARSWRAMGGKVLYTYTLESEPGTSLRAAGWTPDRISDGGQWNTPARSRPPSAQSGPKQRWTSVAP